MGKLCDDAVARYPAALNCRDNPVTRDGAHTLLHASPVPHCPIPFNPNVYKCPCAVVIAVTPAVQVTSTGTSLGTDDLGTSNVLSEIDDTFVAMAVVVLVLVSKGNGIVVGTIK